VNSPAPVPPDTLSSRFVDWLIARAKRTPYTPIHDDDGSLYMERFWLFRFGKGNGISTAGAPYPRFAARIHHICRSDRDRHPHDHPWSYLTIILRGGYFEVRPILKDGLQAGEETQWHGPGSILFRPANSWHRLVIPTGKTAWTLFCTGPNAQEWGFLTEIGKVHWRKYLGLEKQS